MTPIWMRARAELRGRWTSSLVIVLLIGLAGGVALTAAAGARRTETAYPRFLKATKTEDYLVSAKNSGPAAEAVYAGIAKLPEVEESGVVDGTPTFYLRGPRRVDPSVQTVASVDGRAGYSVERLHMLEGRPPRRVRPFEAAVSLQFSKKYGIHTGDTVRFIRVNGGTARPALGPNGRPVVYTFHVTGVEVSFDEIIPIAPNDSLPQMFTTPAFDRLFPNKHELQYDGALVRLRPGANPALFREHLQRLHAEHPEAGTLIIADERDHHARVQDAIRPEAIALAVFAFLAAVAGLLAIGQILSRRIFLDATDYPTLRSLGMNEPQLAMVAVIRGIIVSVAGAALAVVVAILASPLMPIGPARIAEPNRGFEVNLAILGVGFAVIVVFVVAIAAAAGWRAARAGASALGTVEVQRADRPSRIADNASRAGMAPSLVSGVRFALEPGRGRTAVPVRTAMVGIVVAIAAITASFTFGTNLSRLVSTPAEFGRTWNVDLDTGFGPMPRTKIDAVFRSDPAVAAYAGGLYGAFVIDGHQVPAIGLQPLEGSIFPTLVRGRPPRNDHEIVLGVKTLRIIGASVGDTVTVKGDVGERRMRIVGQAVLPSMGRGSFNPTGLGEGAAVTAAAIPFPPDLYNFVLARFRSDVDAAAATKRLWRTIQTSHVCPPDQECVIRTGLLPAELTTYSDIKTVPLVLALLLILMGVAVTAHTLVTSVQRRRRDLATMKTLGFVRPQVLATVASQASVFASVGLLLGLPLGLAAGRWAWTLFANQLGIPPSAKLPGIVVAFAVPAAILIANAVAALPGRSAARTQPAVVLRAE
jgi:ABC-type lipoprotein release transport system permease subunit